MIRFFLLFIFLDCILIELRENLFLRFFLALDELNRKWWIVLEFAILELLLIRNIKIVLILSCVVSFDKISLAIVDDTFVAA